MGVLALIGTGGFRFGGNGRTRQERADKKDETGLADSIAFRVATLRGLKGVELVRIPRAHARGYVVSPRCAGYKVRDKRQATQATQAAHFSSFSSGHGRSDPRRGRAASRRELPLG